MLRRGVHISVRNILAAGLFLDASQRSVICSLLLIIIVSCVLGVPRMKNDEMACDARFGE